MRKMHTHKLDNLLLRPSLFSGVVCALVAIIVPIVVNWSVVLKNTTFYNYFTGPDGLVTELRHTPGTPVTVNDILASKSLGHNASIFVGALAAGVAVFIAVRIVVHLISSVSMTLKEINAVDTPAKHIVEREMERRFVIRIIVAAIWVLYILISIKAILPSAILASQNGFDEVPVSTGIYDTLFAGSLLFFALHFHVIMLRLLVLKPRVFGGEDAVLTE